METRLPNTCQCTDVLSLRANARPMLPARACLLAGQPTPAATESPNTKTLRCCVCTSSCSVHWSAFLSSATPASGPGAEGRRGVRRPRMKTSKTRMTSVLPSPFPTRKRTLELHHLFFSKAAKMITTSLTAIDCISFVRLSNLRPMDRSPNFRVVTK